MGQTGFPYFSASCSNSASNLIVGVSLLSYVWLRIFAIIQVGTFIYYFDVLGLVYYLLHITMGIDLRNLMREDFCTILPYS